MDSGNALVESASESLPQTISLIEDSRKVLKTQADQGSSIKSFAHDLATLTAQLKSSDGDLRKLIGNATPAANQVNSLLKNISPRLSVLLANLISGGQVTLARLPGVEQSLVTFPALVAGSYTVVPGDGTTHFGLVVNADDPPPCTQGYGTTRRDPSDTSTREANTDARCTAPAEARRRYGARRTLPVRRQPPATGTRRRTSRRTTRRPVPPPARTEGPSRSARRAVNRQCSEGSRGNGC